MVYISFIYFSGLLAFLYAKQKCWGIDLAATLLLVVISFFAIMIDVRDIYGLYGINEYSMTLPTVLLFCFQWTVVIALLHCISQLPLNGKLEVKKPLLYIFSLIVAVSAFAMILVKQSDIKEALIMDMADVRAQHYKDLSSGGDAASNYLMLLPNILASAPIPTLALFLWFYLKAFTDSPLILRTGLFVASIVQAMIAIIMAGRAALIYWMFDFFLMYSYFYKVLPPKIKKTIIVLASILGGLAVFMFMSITISRFDDDGTHDPFESIYGYAGQHINNFCAMFTRASDSPFSIDRIFPLTSKVLGHPYDMMEHYETIVSAVKDKSIVVNVFDTFGGEIFLDLGWGGYILFFMLLILIINLVRYNWQEMKLHRMFALATIIAFYVRGLFAWPFNNHYSTMAILLLLFTSYLFKFKFKV